MRNGRFIDENGAVLWYETDCLHRTDGPAVEWADGSCFWFLHGIRYSFSEWIKQANITPEQRTLLLLKWGSHA